MNFETARVNVQKTKISARLALHQIRKSGHSLRHQRTGKMRTLLPYSNLL